MKLDVFGVDLIYDDSIVGRRYGINLFTNCRDDVVVDTYGIDFPISNETEEGMKLIKEAEEYFTAVIEELGFSKEGIFLREDNSRIALNLHLNEEGLLLASEDIGYESSFEEGTSIEVARGVLENLVHCLGDLEAIEEDILLRKEEIKDCIKELFDLAGFSGGEFLYPTEGTEEENGLVITYRFKDWDSILPNIPLQATWEERIERVSEALDSVRSSFALKEENNEFVRIYLSFFEDIKADTISSPCSINMGILPY